MHSRRGRPPSVIHSPFQANGDEGVNTDGHCTNRHKIGYGTQHGRVYPLAVHEISVRERCGEQRNENIVHKQIDQVQAQLRRAYWSRRFAWSGDCGHFGLVRTGTANYGPW